MFSPRERMAHIVLEDDGSHPEANLRTPQSSVRHGALWKAFHSDPYG
jgi:hypothetical protein